MSHFVIVLASFGSLVGCELSETSKEDTLPSFLSPDGSLRYMTPAGEVITGEAVDQNTVRFEITDGRRRFGFELAPERMREWANRRGDPEKLDELRIEYGYDEGVAKYTINGQEYRVGHDQIGSWVPARARFDAEPELPLGLPIDGLSVFDNELGDTLVETLERLGAELTDNSRFVDEDGNCSGAFMTVLGGCLQVKCPLGGVANPVCHACVGTFAACVMMAILHLGGV